MTTVNTHSTRASRLRRVSTAEAKAKLSELIGQVAYGHDRVVIERRGRPVAVLVSMDDADRLQATDAETRRPRGALALVGAWSDVDDDVLDGIVADIYESRARDTGRLVDLAP